MNIDEIINQIETNLITEEEVIDAIVSENKAKELNTKLRINEKIHQNLIDKDHLRQELSRSKSTDEFIDCLISKKCFISVEIRNLLVSELQKNQKMEQEKRKKVTL